MREGETTCGPGPSEPLRLSRVDPLASNLRNLRSRRRVHPSPLRLDAVVSGAGRLALDGDADFLAEPHPGVLAEVSLEGVTGLARRAYEAGR